MLKIKPRLKLELRRKKHLKEKGRNRLDQGKEILVGQKYSHSYFLIIGITLGVQRPLN